MILEFLISTILWTGIDQHTDAKLQVSCDQVQLQYGGKPTANPALVTFYEKDERYEYTWSYTVAMDVSPTGSIILDPTEYWIEEIRKLDVIAFKINQQVYAFNLKGSHKALKECDGVVAE